MTEDSRPAGEQALAETATVPYLFGRLTGLACHMADRYPPMSCDGYAAKIARGGLPPLPSVYARLRGLVLVDLRWRRLPGVYRQAFDDIEARFGTAPMLTTGTWPPASPEAAQFMLGQHHQSAALTRVLTAPPA